MTAPTDPLVGTVVAGRYKVIKLLGEGGMGAVYLAEHSAIEKKLALKVLHPEYATKGDIVTRFQQEAISASRIKHPNVLEVFDFGQLDDGSFFLAMEFLEGNDLADEIQKSRVLDARRGLGYALQICRALAAAHAKGVVHRDMKPENVFLQRTSDGEDIVKIVDFGIAQLRTNEEAAAGAKQRRLTRTGMIFGTPEYMSPEQAAGRHADQRADVYAVGIILYEMFTGAVPFTGETFLGVLAKHLNEAPPAMTAVYPELGLSQEFQAVVYRALEKNPDARFQSMTELSQALQATPEGRGVFAFDRAALSASATEFHEYQEVPTGAFTSPQFKDRDAASRAPTAPGVTLSQPLGTAGALSSPELSGRRNDGATHGNALAAAAGTVAPAPSRSGLVLGIVALALAGAGGFFFLTKGNAEPAATVAPELPPPAQTVAAPPPSPAVPVAPAPVPAPAPSASVAPAAVVRLAVSTEPSGATLFKDGFQVCDSTPCEVTAAPNETLELEAVKGSAKGKAKVLAQRDQSVGIKLASAVAGPKPSAKTREERLCEVEVDGIKILRPCK
jgi:eukaryotic-like serine/threonine-protein kinase